ncbi:MAG: aminotransferase family protein [Erysipelotrichaceae bacterium]|nr:MAG: aminotransferase family [Erysipelotrichaceae bacterium]TXT18471.1 MAG: aminotransferase family protein [Erysipelotrichaceae bacterium]
MEKYIPLSVPNLKGNELKYISEAVESEWVSVAGPFVNKFEKDLANYVKVKEAVACQSGTAGIHLALLALGINKNHEVLVPSLTFIAAVNPVTYVNATPVFLDCDDTLTLDVDKLEAFIQNDCDFKNGLLINMKTKKHIKALIVVHVFGNIADMERLMPLCRKYNLKVIEDATEALGSYYIEGFYKGKYAGTIGDIGIYSFNGNKIITTGGGGMIVSESSDLLKTCKHLSTQAKSNEKMFYHDQIGYNYRLTNLQAALGVAQLEQLESFIQIKKDNYFKYRALIKTDNLSILDFRKDIRPNYWFYSLFIKDFKAETKESIILALEQHSIQSRPIWGLINEQPPYIHHQTNDLSMAKFYWQHVLNIPCSSNLSPLEVEFVAGVILKNKGLQ